MLKQKTLKQRDAEEWEKLRSCYLHHHLTLYTSSLHERANVLLKVVLSYVYLTENIFFCLSFSLRKD